MINEQKIPCPQCKTDIHFDVTILLQGGGFSCKTCSSVVSIASDSMSEAKNVYKTYESLAHTSKSGVRS